MESYGSWYEVKTHLPGGAITVISVEPISIRGLRRRLDIGQTKTPAITPPSDCIESYKLRYEVKTQ